MISKLKRRFITLAMASLVVMLTVIVAGMNIINYNTVVSNADGTLEMLSYNQGRLPLLFGYDIYDMYDEIEGALDISVPDDHEDDYDEDDDHEMRGRAGRAPRWMTRDEAEETRYFTVLMDSTGTAVVIDTDRIYAVDQEEAEKYAAKVISSGRERGFIKDYRYEVVTEGSFSRVTFLDCGRSLEAFRGFLRASVLMSLIGLLFLFGIICYFAGRIVKPVAESYEKQKRFITDAGHEIKTPLTIIKANLELMRMDLDDLEEAAGLDTEPDETGGEDKPGSDAAVSLNESLSDIDGQVDRLTNLTNDLVYLSRMEEEGNEMRMTEIPVSDIVAETVDSFEALAHEREKYISADIVPMLSMNGSSNEIEKLVSILVENALKYSPEGDTIHVSLNREGKNIILEVRNRTNSPMSDEDLAHVFERFYRTDKSRNSEAGGHGIGLSIASAIVSLHGGRIRARSGDGTEFIVTATLPAIS